MSREWDALQALKTSIANRFDATPQTGLTSAQVVIGYPDVDRLPYPAMIYLVPDLGEMQRLTTESLLESVRVTAYVIHKHTSANNSMELLLQAVLDYYAALVNAINYDTTCDGELDDTFIHSFDIYPAVTGMTNTAGVEVQLEMQFERPPIVLPEDDLYPGDGVLPVGG